MTLLLSDRSLLDAFRRGERQAIERVYQAYVDQVARLLRRGFFYVSGGRTHRFRGYDSEWELECAVQDTFIQALAPGARLAYDGISPFGPYLLTIARNRALSTLRSESREQRRRSALAAEPPPPPQESPERLAQRRELATLVAEFQQSLPADLGRFLELRYGEERKLLDVARQLGISRMQARTREEKLRRLFVDFLRRRGLLTSTAGAPTLLGCLTLLVHR